jgi:hypothetical protein
MLTVNNLSVQFGKRILFDEVNTTLHIYGVIEATELEIYIPQNNFWWIYFRTCPFRNRKTYVGFKSKPQYV